MLGRLLPGGTRLGHSGEAVELGQQPVRVGEQAGDVLPDRAFDRLGLTLRLGQAAVRALRMQSLPGHP